MKAFQHLLIETEADYKTKIADLEEEKKQLQTVRSNASRATMCWNHGGRCIRDCSCAANAN